MAKELETKDYWQMYESLGLENSQLHTLRADLEAQLADVNKKIEHIQNTMRHLSPLATGGQASEFDDIMELGFTDAVRSVLYDQPMSAAEIKAKMEERGFDFSKYSAPDASIRKILQRLADTNRAELIKDGHKAFYKSKLTDEEFGF